MNFLLKFWAPVHDISQTGLRRNHQCIRPAAQFSISPSNILDRPLATIVAFVIGGWRNTLRTPHDGNFRVRGSRKQQVRKD